MELITDIAAWIVTIFAGFLGNILAHDACNSADRICTKIIHRAALRLAEFDQEPVEMEWLADLNERETVFEKYRHAIGCYAAAGPMRRRALAITIAVDLSVVGFQTIPLRFGTGLSFKMVATTAAWKMRPFSYFWASCLSLYLIGKLLVSVYRTDAGNFRRFVAQLSQFKTWRYEVRLERKNLKIDLSTLMRLVFTDREKAKDYIEKMIEILKGDSGDAPIEQIR